MDGGGTEWMGVAHRLNTSPAMTGLNIMLHGGLFIGGFFTGGYTWAVSGIVGAGQSGLGLGLWFGNKNDVDAKMGHLLALSASWDHYDYPREQDCDITHRAPCASSHDWCMRLTAFDPLLASRSLAPHGRCVRSTVPRLPEGEHCFDDSDCTTNFCAFVGGIALRAATDPDVSATSDVVEDRMSLARTVGACRQACTADSEDGRRCVEHEAASDQAYQF